jgi:MYXO-CTERM domain-containing protein
MGVLNKRNAVLGWAAWQVGKRAMKQKAKGATRVETSNRRPGKGAVAALLAAVGGALVFWRRRREPE